MTGVLRHVVLVMESISWMVFCCMGGAVHASLRVCAVFLPVLGELTHSCTLPSGFAVGCQVGAGCVPVGQPHSYTVAVQSETFLLLLFTS
jgi:hypothetical protein